MQKIDEVYSGYKTVVANTLRQQGRVNIIVGGSAGVGKSTIINAVLGANVAMIGMGRSVTQNIVQYTYPGRPIAIYDTRGFEIKESAKTIGAVNDKIAQLRSATDPNEQIHVAWVCILEQSHRVEPIHTSFLQMLAQRDVPAIVVLTQAFGEVEMFAAATRLAVPNCGILPVMAERRIIAGHAIEPYGTGELVEMTLKLLPKAQRAAFIAAQGARWDLKEKAVFEKISESVYLAGTSAMIPIPGGHSVALVGLQAKLIAEINTTLGLAVEDVHGKEYFKGFLGILMAQMGGGAAFGMALSETLKFIPGLGWLGAAAIGGTIGAAITKVFGHVYFDTVKKYAKNELPLPSQEDLVAQMTSLLQLQRGHYIDQASSAP